MSTSMAPSAPSALMSPDHTMDLAKESVTAPCSSGLPPSARKSVFSYSA